jgi:RNA-directed DNA polymerase
MNTTKPFQIPKSLVWEAWQQVKANKGAAGIDRQSLSDFEKNLKDKLYKIWNRLSSGSYLPPPVKGVEISKKSGGTRLLGVPTCSDRIAQTVVKLQLEPIVEKVFLPDSYAYRAGKSAHDAVAAVRKRCWKYDWVLEFDIRRLFDEMRHDLIMRSVKRRKSRGFCAVLGGAGGEIPPVYSPYIFSSSYFRITTATLSFSSDLFGYA